MSEQNGRKVDWRVFVWAISIISTILFISFGVSMSAKTDVGDVRGEVREIKTNISWIKDTLSRIEDKIE